MKRFVVYLDTVRFSTGFIIFKNSEDLVKKIYEIPLRHKSEYDAGMGRAGYCSAGYRRIRFPERRDTDTHG